MRIISRARQMGKTTELIGLLRKNDKRLFVTFSLRERDRLRETYSDVASRIFYFEELEKNNPEHKVVLVDNLDYIINRVLGTWVEVGTITKGGKIELR